MKGDLIVVFGGSGFLGRQVVRALAKAGKRVRVPMRRPHLGHELRVCGDVGQVQLVQANVRYRQSVDRALEGADGVVNLIGLLYEKGSQNFQAAHVRGAVNIAECAAARGIDRFVQVSAIGADPNSKSAYARTKGEAEGIVRKAIPAAVILRPSIIFGPGDGFFNRFAGMARFTPFLPLIGMGKTQFQPIFVGDVAQAVCKALDAPGAPGRIFELGGPKTYSFKELLHYITRTIDRPRILLPLPFFFAQPLGMFIDAFFRLIPFAGPPLTGDQVQMLRSDNVVTPSREGGVLTIADLGVHDLETVEAIAPSYLWRFRPHGQFQDNVDASAKP